MQKDELSTAQRAPRGQPYSSDKKTGGVDYKVPQGPQPSVEDEPPVLSILNEKGQEIPDSVPMEPPLGYSTAPSLADFVHRMIHNEISQAAAAQEFETFEESDDFDVEDDPIDPLTPYEAVFNPPPSPPAPPSLREGKGDAGGGEGSQISPSPPPAVPTTSNENPTSK